MYMGVEHREDHNSSQLHVSREPGLSIVQWSKRKVSNFTVHENVWFSDGVGELPVSTL